MFLREHTEPVSSLPGAGPAFARAAERIGVRSVADLLTLYPRDYEDRREVVPLARAVGSQASVVLVTVVAHRWFGHAGRKTLVITVRDESSTASLLCFNRRFLERALAVGTRHYLYGIFGAGRGGIEATAFEHESYRAEPRWFLRMLPVYPLTAGLSQAALRRVVGAALAAVLPIEDELPRSMAEEASLADKATALRQVHFPTDQAGLDAARRTLKYEELVHLHLATTGRRPPRAPHAREPSRRAGAASSALREALIRRLPFALTADQLRALREIDAGLLSGSPSARLVQGDVGCGKTLVALLACLLPIAAGEQAAIMAPTELLARQHADNASRLLEPLGVRVAFLSSGLPVAARRSLLDALSGVGSGGVDLVVGTHALFTEDVRYRRLGLAVIDEQQRFGVAQRRELVAKGGSSDLPPDSPPDLLLMTATPIPRTLALTVFGDLEVSEIRGMPSGRLPVATHLAREGNEKKVYDRVRQELRKGHQAYFVYPMIRESRETDLRDAERAFVRLRDEVYPEWECGLMHSRVPEEEKEARMRRFVSGDVRVLVATSVVEVGVDVPNATCMVVEHADRFGLSALHQLRGRVGRGPAQSYAFLIYSRELTEAGVQRLRIMKETTDGFRIAEEDLKLRGPGALLGVEQAGHLGLGLTDLSRDLELVVEVRDRVRSLLARDPELETPENLPLRRAHAISPGAMGGAARGG